MLTNWAGHGGNASDSSSHGHSAHNHHHHQQQQQQQQWQYGGDYHGHDHHQSARTATGEPKSGHYNNSPYSPLFFPETAAKETAKSIPSTPIG
ncbi:hypothetical protein EV182_005627, partial [Spiromyces aspiralis]